MRGVPMGVIAEQAGRRHSDRTDFLTLGITGDATVTAVGGRQRTSIDGDCLHRSGVRWRGSTTLRLATY